jgi:hypothetical protein
LRSPFIAALLIVAYSTLLARAQTTTRVSVDSHGNQANDHSFESATSLDGRWIGFASQASNLVPGDNNHATDVFVRDRKTGSVARVSVSSAGNEAHGSSYFPDISATGRFVAFVSDASDLVAGDTNNATDIFVHDRDPDENNVFDEGNGTTSRVSLSSPGAQADADSFEPAISSDGRFITFASNATNLVEGDTNGFRDVFVRDRDPDGDGVFDDTNGKTVRVSVGPVGEQGNGTSGYLGASGGRRSIGISADGRSVVFPSDASNLVAGDGNAARDVFVRDRDPDGDGIFDDVNAATVLISVFGTEHGRGDSGSWGMAISGSGRFVAFESNATNWTSSRNYQIYVRDRDPDGNGRFDEGNETTAFVSVNTGGDFGDNLSAYPAMSQDGRFIVFQSTAGNLVDGDDQYSQEIFLRDRDPDRNGVFDESGSTTTRVSKSSTGEKANAACWFPEIGADPRLITFDSTSSNLTPPDTNGVFDVFARDPIELHFSGTPKYPFAVNFGLDGAHGEAGHLALVMLSCSGTSGFPLPDGRTVPLLFDSCTATGLANAMWLSDSVSADGTAFTPVLFVPPAPPGVTIYAAAVTADAATVVSITGPISFTTL